MDTEKILEKVRRLLALSKSSNEFEAAAAAAKAQELLWKHKLEIHDVPTDDGKVVGEEFERFAMAAGNSAPWRGQLINSIAMNNDCRVVTSVVPGYYSVIGQKSSFEVVEYLFDYLSTTIERLAKEHRQETTAWKNGFKLGAVSAVWNTLAKQRKQDAASSVGMALVVVNDKALEDKMQELFPRLRKGKLSKISNYSGFNSGYREGEKIGINRAIPTGSSTTYIN